jgi:hypothetical protein
VVSASYGTPGLDGVVTSNNERSFRCGSCGTGQYLRIKCATHYKRLPWVLGTILRSTSAHIHIQVVLTCVAAFEHVASSKWLIFRHATPVTQTKPVARPPFDHFKKLPWHSLLKNRQPDVSGGGILDFGHKDLGCY